MWRFRHCAAAQAIPRGAQSSVAACVSSLVVASGQTHVAKTVAACLATVNAEGSSTAARRLALLVLGKIGTSGVAALFCSKA